jgi:hypothetical protein
VTHRPARPRRAPGSVEQRVDFVEPAKHYPALKNQWVEFLGERTSGETERVETTEVQAA